MKEIIQQLRLNLIESRRRLEYLLDQNSKASPVAVPGQSTDFV